MGPETSMEVQAALGSDIALVFDECTPFHVTRDYTARSTERTHRWLDRCLDWHAAHGPDGQARLRHRPGRHGGGPAALVGPGGRGARRVGSPSAARSAQDKAQMYEVVGWATEELPEDRPRHLLGIGDVDDLDARRGARHRHVRLRDADAHRPPRHGAGARSRSAAGGSTSPRPATARPTSRSLDGCPCPACAAGYSRAYLHYLSAAARADRRAARSRSTTSPSCSVLMAALRAAIDAGRLAEATAASRAGAAPWDGLSRASATLSSISVLGVVARTVCSASPSICSLELDAACRALSAAA